MEFLSQLVDTIGILVILCALVAIPVKMWDRYKGNTG